MLGPDIESVFKELTSPCTVTTIDKVLHTGEYVDSEHYVDQSTEFVRQFCFKGSHPYNSFVQEGCLLNLNNKIHLVTNVKEELFEGSIVTKESFFVECNQNPGCLMRETSIRVNYALQRGWAVVSEYDSVYGLQVDLQVSSSANMEQIESSQSLFGTSQALYLPFYGEVKTGDRWYPNKADILVPAQMDNPSNYYLVEFILSKKIKNCLYIQLKSDRR